MRFGVREICDVVFKPLTSVDIAGQHFDAGQPVLYLDTAKTSTLEGTATTVYAQGGKGNPRLIGWDGEKVITFTVEDALMSPVSFAMLSGAGVIKATEENGEKVYVHTAYDLVVEEKNNKKVAVLSPEERNKAKLVVSREAPVYPVILDSAGAQSLFLSAVTDEEIFVGTNADSTQAATIGEYGEVELKDDDYIIFELTSDSPGDSRHDDIKVGQAVRVDCYTVHNNGAWEMEIEAGTFAGYYYIEASTLFRDEATGVDMPAEFVIPRGKIQSNFTFSMAASGDPSTFTFTIDAFPAYTKFNKKKKVMAVLQVVEPLADSHNYSDKKVLGHEDRTNDDEVKDWYSHSVFSEEKLTDRSENEEQPNQGGA